MRCSTEWRNLESLLSFLSIVPAIRACCLGGINNPSPLHFLSAQSEKEEEEEEAALMMNGKCMYACSTITITSPIHRQ